MSTAIVYYSQHHGNTKKLLDAIKEYDPDIKLIDTTKTKVEDLSPYDRIGIASGIYFGKFNKDLTEYIKKINDLERVKNEQDLRNLRAKHQKEQEEAQMQISLLSDENFPTFATLSKTATGARITRETTTVGVARHTNWSFPCRRQSIFHS